VRRSPRPSAALAPAAPSQGRFYEKSASFVQMLFIADDKVCLFPYSCPALKQNSSGAGYRLLRALHPESLFPLNKVADFLISSEVFKIIYSKALAKTRC